jgi:hypothetical protein
MNKYGEPLLNEKNNLIGYKLNDKECVSINTYFNSDNLLCNKVSVKEFDENKKSFKNEHDVLTY